VPITSTRGCAISGEENVHYRVDQKGGVHLAVDQEFEANRVATLAHLEAPRYANVARNFDEAHDRLSEVPPQGKNAIRAIFGAVEGLFRLMFPNEDRLTAKAAKTRLAATVQRKYQGNAPALGAASKLIQGFELAMAEAGHTAARQCASTCDWTSAANSSMVA